MKPEDAPIRLGEWLIQPQLNRLSRPGVEDVRLEPKMMDVLVCLARRSGDVVSREELIDAVWPDLFISESVLTRAIAGLRRALGDDARHPRFIETIAKRGYRLLGATARFTPGRGVSSSGVTYVVGQWVRAEKFYGREAELREVLKGPRNGYWAVATRRRGKTSFLKQLEHLSAEQPDLRLFPVFWDLQGTDNEDALAFCFEEALADVEPQLEDAGIALADVTDSDIFRMLGGLRRRLRADDRILFLLCDEAEELLNLPIRTINRLRHSLLSQDGVRTVLASGPRLWDLAKGSPTSPFLDGFLPPLYLGPLKRSTAQALVSQSQVAGDAKPELSDDDVDAICRWSGGHPFLLQLLSKRVVECGDLDQGVAAVAADRSVTTLFEVDLDLLSDLQRSLLQSLARQQEESTVEHLDSQAMLELQQLGLVEIENTNQPQIALPLLKDWLTSQ